MGWLFLLLLALMAFTAKAKRVEQRATIKFLQKTGQTPIQIWRALHDVFQGDCLSKTQVREWFNWFKGGTLETTTADKPRPGRPKCRARFARQIRTIVERDGRTTLKRLSEETGLAATSVHRVLHQDLKFSKISAKFIPRVLTQEQKNFRTRLCNENLALLRHDKDLLERIITTDESWFSVFEPVTKQESSIWTRKGGARLKKALRSRLTKKTMLVLFFDTAGVVHLEFLPRGQTVNTDAWLAILGRLKESIHRKRPVMWRGGFQGNKDKDFLLHMDNAPSHVAVRSLAFYGENDFELLSHPAYSPDLAPCDFWAFPYLKAQMRGTRYGTIQELQQAIKTLLRRTPAETFQDAIYEMPIRWSKCVQAQGEFFEGSGIVHNPDHLPSSDSDTDTDSDAH